MSEDRAPHEIDDLLVRRLTRRSVLRAGIGAVGLAATPSLLTACGGDDEGGALSELREAGVVRMGTPNNMPSSGIQGGRAVGIFPEMGALVFKELEVPKVEPVDMEFGAQIPSLQAGRIDAGAGGLYVLPERCRAVTFSDPLLGYLEAMAVPRGNPEGIRTYEDVAKKDLRFGVLSATAEIPLGEAAGIEADQFQKYPDLPAMLDALKAGRIDAAAFDSITITYFVNLPANRDRLEATEPYPPKNEQGQRTISFASMGFQKGQEDLAREFNKVAKRLRDEGAFDPIFKKWDVPQLSVTSLREASLSRLCEEA